MKSRFGHVLKRLRLLHGWGLRPLARELGVSAPYLCGLEKGRIGTLRNKARLDRIVQLLELSDEEKIQLMDAVSSNGGLPPDLEPLMQRQLIPVLLRAIDQRRLSDQDLEVLIDNIQKRGKHR